MKHKLYENLATMTAAQFEQYLEQERLGNLLIKKHPQDPTIQLMNYSDQAVYKKNWNEQTMNARGMIVDICDLETQGIVYILAKPFEKFFNMGENKHYEQDIDFSEQPLVMEKVDGSMGVSYFFNGGIRFATRGSFTSDQAIKATMMWKEKYEQNWDLEAYIQNPYTIVTEIIYPENRIVVNYADKEELVMLGIINLKNLSDEKMETVQNFAVRFGMRAAAQYPLTIEKMLVMKEEINSNEEGWIIRFSNDKRLKIKGAEYLTVHKLMHGISEKKKAILWGDDQLENAIIALPDEFQDEMKQYKETLDAVFEEILCELTVNFKKAKQFSDKKEQALFIQATCEGFKKNILFDAVKNDCINSASLKKRIALNYKEYIRSN